ncbi:hypothetical protein [Hoylesella nanceiensis]
MIYIIDDKLSRQNDYGWTIERFSEYSNIEAINNLLSLKEKLDNIFSSEENIILFHESFLNSSDPTVQEVLKELKDNFKKYEGQIPIAYFSGSKSSRWIGESGKVAMMPPDVLYHNLAIFIDKYINGEFDFKYLLFGKNIQLESSLKEHISEVNDANWGKGQFSISKNVFFAFTESYACESPFSNAYINCNWDFYSQTISDEDLDKLTTEWFANTEYDAIYIPLCFGQTLSDFMGLRLAMHIRLTETKCQYKPIYIYGEATIEDIKNNDCFDALKFSGVSLIHCDYDSMKHSIENNPSQNSDGISRDILSIKLDIPTNIGDNHSVANQWAIYRWKEMFQWKSEEPEIINTDFNTNLYFKYLIARFGKHDKFKSKKKIPCNISDIKGKTILYIDDEYNKGWGNIMEAIFKSNGAKSICYKDFSKKYSKEDLINNIKNFLNENEADCYLLDLRLHEDDFTEIKNLTGHEIAQYIKQQNKGNQIVVFTASNKIWNLKKQLLEFGAVGYALKESPESNYNRDESRELFIEFSKTITKACKLSFLKKLYNQQQILKKINVETEELDNIIDLLIVDDGNNNASILKSVLLTEIVFLEHYISQVDKLSLFKTSEEAKESLQLCLNGREIHKLTGHLFVKREEQSSGRKNIIEAEYFKDETATPSDWSNVSDSDAVLIIASLYLYYGLSKEAIKQYIEIKLIRNTQVAHLGEQKLKVGNDYKQRVSITIEKLKDFYYDVIVPVVLHNKQNIQTK